ncbi:MAG: glutathione peroxidase [Clostridiaceae bacterium]|jgi:glutathione peroxidase|nr:glutathione peroxidase [Clostridiaceae bacterium]MDF2951139.1 glutathione peroxidase [Anaerocolumna sp.]
MNIYDFKVKETSGNEISLGEYKGKVLLIVNTATGCGFTPQYEALENLYKKYKEQGFEILDFPCNQFLNQAPGTNEEIVSFCQLKYGVTFKTFSKIKVNGENADPLYKFLKEEVPLDEKDTALPGLLEKLKGLGQVFLGAEIKWNFTKFLVSKDGNIIARFAPTYDMDKVEQAVADQLNK